MIRRWLAAHWRFVSDPVTAELLQDPRTTLRTILEPGGPGEASGDCDDAALLGAALGMAVGLPVRWRVLGFAGNGGTYGHVMGYLWTGGRWLDLDVTRPLSPLPVIWRDAFVGYL